jgi:hypothetical protein
LLIDEASPETIRAVLRMLLDDVAPPAAIPPTVRPLPTASHLAALRRTQRAATTSQTPNAEWEALRQQVRTTRLERGMNYADLAAALGCKKTSLEVNLQRRQPASQPLIAALRAWLEAPTEQVPEVTPPIAPFRRRGNGSGVVASVAGVPASA